MSTPQDKIRLQKQKQDYEDEVLKQQINKNLQDKAAKAADQASRLKEQQEAEKNKNVSDPLLKDFRKKLEELKKSELRSYNTWADAMLAIFQVTSAMGEAFAAARGNTGFTLERAVNSSIDNIKNLPHTIPEVFNNMKHNAQKQKKEAGQLTTKEGADFVYADSKKSQLSEIDCNFSVDNAGVLNAKPTINGKPLPADHQKEFMSAAYLWLMENGYQVKDDGRNPVVATRAKDGKLLTQQDFDTLNDVNRDDNLINTMVNALNVAINPNPEPLPVAPSP